MKNPPYILLYDRDCGICSAVSRWIRTLDWRGRIRLQSLQSSRYILVGIPEVPLPDVLVSIEVRSQIADRVVQVKRADSSQADRLADRAEECVVALPRSEVVARGKGVARVDADSKAVRVGAPLDDLGELLEPGADHGPLSRRVLEDREDVGRVRMVEGPVEALGRCPDRRGLPFPSVAGRMKDHIADSEGLCPVDGVGGRRCPSCRRSSRGSRA